MDCIKERFSSLTAHSRCFTTQASIHTHTHGWHSIRGIWVSCPGILGHVDCRGRGSNCWPPDELASQMYLMHLHNTQLLTLFSILFYSRAECLIYIDSKMNWKASHSTFVQTACGSRAECMRERGSPWALSSQSALVLMNEIFINPPVPWLHPHTRKQITPGPPWLWFVCRCWSTSSISRLPQQQDSSVRLSTAHKNAGWISIRPSGA